MEIGRHWNDGINLGARARFDENSKPEPVLWIESLRDSDQGTYRCRVDFKQAPTKNFKINLNVIGKSSSLDFLNYFIIILILRNFISSFSETWLLTCSEFPHFIQDFDGNSKRKCSY